ncbi:MAG TPA: GNAT family N-acetyltransferase [Dongiaceae bacterium]|jgi:GNAT superfamily N-acetyltransferase|nr:GNAT family N-acetyltransferase [Dongiaceae bacterium]
MAGRWTVRPASIDDAEAISRVIVQAVEETNAKDYPPSVIAEVIKNFSPERVAERLPTRQVFVATEQGAVVGTGSLEGTTIRSVFVLPRFERRGIGRALMDHIEGLARSAGVSRLEVPSSIGAEGFYRRLGYVAIRDEHYGAERTILMGKAL